MAVRFWRGIVDTDSTKVGNWAATSGGAGGASVPGSGDTITYDSGGDNPCTLFANLAHAGFDMQATFSAKIDLATFNLVGDDGADVTLAGSGEFAAGTATTIALTNGDFDNSAVGTYTRGTSTLSMSGVGNLISTVGKFLLNFTAESGSTIDVTENIQAFGTATINGTLSVATGKTFFSNVDATTVFGASGRLTGLGTYSIETPVGGQGITVFPAGAVVDISVLQFSRPESGDLMIPGTYDAGVVRLHSSSAIGQPFAFELSSGSYVFSGDLEFSNIAAGATIVIDNSINNSNIEILGDVIRTETAGTITYTRGTGTMTLSGTSNQAIDFGGQAIEALTVDKSAGTVTQGDDMSTAAFAGVDGSYDPAGFATAVDGNCDWAAAFGFSGPTEDPLDGSAWTIGGDFTADGQSLFGSAGWTLSVVGSAVASGVGSVAGCDASGGTEIHAVGWTDGGLTTNWEFDAKPPLFQKANLGKSLYNGLVSA